MNKHTDFWKKEATVADICDRTLKPDIFLEQIISEISPVVERGGTILDYGCGIGRLTMPIARKFKFVDVVGYDISNHFLAKAVMEADKQNMWRRCLFTADLFSLKADAAYSTMVLQHLPAKQKQAAIMHISEHLKPGGIFRFQYVEGDADTFLTHDASFADIKSWCYDADIKITKVDYDVIKPRWTWVTGVKL
jgi:2-polyprenyl-3-methyl-5-hydroxy-6-metoxy-1,4-benzoquinol methylase